MSGPARSWFVYFSRVRTIIISPFSDKCCLSRKTILPTSPTPSPSTIMPCACTLPTSAACSCVSSSTSPEESIFVFSFGIPSSCASSAWYLRCWYSPCTGIAYLGFVSVYISLISSCEAWPDTCVSCTITFAPFSASSLITFDTDFSLPGIGLELNITVSPGSINTFLCIFAAILESAAIASPWLPVVISTSFSEG